MQRTARRGAVHRGRWRVRPRRAARFLSSGPCLEGTAPDVVDALAGAFGVIHIVADRQLIGRSQTKESSWVVVHGGLGVVARDEIDRAAGVMAAARQTNRSRGKVQ